MPTAGDSFDFFLKSCHCSWVGCRCYTSLELGKTFFSFFCYFLPVKVRSLLSPINLFSGQNSHYLIVQGEYWLVPSVSVVQSTKFHPSGKKCYCRISEEWTPLKTKHSWHPSFEIFPMHSEMHKGLVQSLNVCKIWFHGWFHETSFVTEFTKNANQPFSPEAKVCRTLFHRSHQRVSYTISGWVYELVMKNGGKSSLQMLLSLIIYTNLLKPACCLCLQ